MTTTALRITLIDPVIASSDVATAAVPSSLPYLPGAMLWGIFANHVYQDSSLKPRALDLLHGGGPVFSDALPEVGGTVALPAPKSLHRHKDGGDWQDWVRDGRAAGFKQAKSGQLGPWQGRRLSDWPEVRVRMESTQRTAIDPNDLRAAPGQIYGLQALSAAQSFVATISGDAGHVATAMQALSQVRVLGRSRNAEFGRVRIEPVQVPALPDPGPNPAMILWCLSDLAAHDDKWQPTERPDRLLDAEIDWSRSFVRHRAYAPFNATWQTRQPERLVITRGSVLVLKTPVTAGFHRVGFWAEQGLGHVLASARAPLELLQGWANTAAGHASPPTTHTALSRLLLARVQSAKQRTRQRETALGVWAVWGPRYATAETLQGIRCGPTGSQWGALAQLGAQEARDFLQRQLNSPGARERQGWLARFETGPGGTFAEKALAVLDADGETGLKRTAKALRDAIKRERWFDAT